MTPDRWRQIENLYQAVKSRPAGDRAALLECTDPEIRERVERMLEVDSGSALVEEAGSAFPSTATRNSMAAGGQLGPYRLGAQIGAGGMGTVYRAIDTRLGRTVAIKIASERYGERFQLEARAISRLNHPNVCTLYDVGPDYLVMEFLEGPTLAAELKRGPLGMAVAARYGAQIALALGEAHAMGIVHRDLKPGNVMLTRHGVKVLDFGLAKISPVGNTDSRLGLTGTGAIMGTPAYMAPEQVEGREPAGATDLFALGLVLYEMAVGKLPFPGASLGQMLSSGSQARAPAPSRARAGVPAELDGLVSRLLEKDPAKRPQSAAEVARELTLLADKPARQWGQRAAIAALAVAPLALAVLLYLRSRAPERESPVPRDLSTYTQVTSFSDTASGPVLSPDGKLVAFYRSGWRLSPVEFTSEDIWVKLLPNGEAVQVTHDRRPKYNIAFSPDSSRIAYTVFEQGQFNTYTVPSLGGDSQLMLSNAAGLSWMDDGRLLFSQFKTGVHLGVVTSKADRSGLREIYFPAFERRMAHFSWLSPDKKWVVVAEMDPEWHRCRVVPFAGGSLGTEVGPDGACTAAAWSKDARWLYLAAGVNGRWHLWRERFPGGRPEQFTFGSTDEDGVTMMPDGRSLITSINSEQDTIWIHDAHGDRALSSEGYAAGERRAFSSDGRRLYYLMRRNSPESPAELVRAELASGKTEVLTPGISVHEFDISPDEKEAVFSRREAGEPEALWIAPLDRSAAPRKIVAAGASNPYFGPGDEVVFRMLEGKAASLSAVKRDGSGARKVLTRPILGLNGISPDRRMVLIDAAEPGNEHPGVLAVPLDGGLEQLLCDGPCDFTWSPDGRYLYLLIDSGSRDNPEGRSVAIPIPPGQDLPPLPPEHGRGTLQWTKVPGAKFVERGYFAPGLNWGTYAYVKVSVQANLFQIPTQ